MMERYVTQRDMLLGKQLVVILGELDVFRLWFRYFGKDIKVIPNGVFLSCLISSLDFSS
jgi:hypothetical protein